MEGLNQFSPLLWFASTDFQGTVRANEALRYYLQIVSDQFVSAEYQVFEVAWDGTWDSNLDVMQRSLVIRELPPQNL